MNDNCLVSVIIPVYNAQKELKQNIESLLAQTYKGFELIYVDDGSTDGSRQVIEQFVQKDARVVYYYQENSGAGVARNTGMSKAKGKYIIFLDADDYFEETLLEKTVTISEKHDLDICITGASIIADDRENKYDCFNAIVEKYLPSQHVFSVYENPDNAFLISGSFAWNKLYRQQFIIENGLEFQNLRSINDLSFVFYSFVKAKRIAVCPERLVNYRLGNSLGLTVNNDRQPDNIFLAYLELKSLLEKDGLFGTFEKSFCRMASWDLITALSRMRTLELFRHVYQMIKGKYGSRLGLLDRPDDYYVDDRVYKQMETIFHCNEEEFLFDLSVMQKEIIANQDYMIKDRDTWIQVRDRWIEERDGWIQERDGWIQERDAIISKLKEKKRWYFDEGKYPQSTKFILYGLGKVGKDFACQLMNSKHSNLVAVIDQDSAAIDRSSLEGVSVGGMAILSDIVYDYVIISPRKVEVAEQIKADLLDFGVQEDKIICPILEERDD